MNCSKSKILAAAVGTKRLGFAVFQRTELLYFAVKTLKLPRTRRRVKRQVTLLTKKAFSEFKPKLLILKTLGKQQANSRILPVAVNQIKKEAEASGNPVIEISFEQVKAILCKGQKPTKRNAFKALSEAYPELKRFIHYNNLSQAEYYNSLLSAVAVGYAYQSNLLQPDQKPI